jgi:hypothetical protein
MIWFWRNTFVRRPSEKDASSWSDPSHNGGSTVRVLSFPAPRRGGFAVRGERPNRYEQLGLLGIGDSALCKETGEANRSRTSQIPALDADVEDGAASASSRRGVGPHYGHQLLRGSRKESMRPRWFRAQGKGITPVGHTPAGLEEKGEPSAGRCDVQPRGLNASSTPEIGKLGGANRPTRHRSSPRKAE